MSFLSYFTHLHLDLLARGLLQRTYLPLLISVLTTVLAWLVMRRLGDGPRRVTVLAAGGKPVAFDPDCTTIFQPRRAASLEGTWRLLAVEARSEGRTISTPFGRHPVGRLVYMADGRMSVMLMAPDRAKLGSHGLRAGTGPQKAAAFDSFLAYTGRYQRLEDRVIHHPDVASIPDFVGVPEERFVSLEGDRLILSTPPMLEGGRIRTFVIVWQRVRTLAQPDVTIEMLRAG